MSRHRAPRRWGLNRRHRRTALWGVGILVMLCAASLGPGPAGAASGDGSFSAAKTVTRVNLNADGAQAVVDSRDFTVSVSQTQNLRNRQDVTVSWTGAHPSGNIQSDYNSTVADQTEYPVVVLECRGQDPDQTQGIPASSLVSPQTCATHGLDERFQQDPRQEFAPWRLDAFADAADRAAIVGRPASVPASCNPEAANERWLPFLGVDGTTYAYGNGNTNCAVLTPEDYTNDSSSASVPPNATFAATGLDGTGSVKFDIATDEQNASLGCSPTVACVLEVIPIMGLSCDPFGVSPVAAGLAPGDIPTPGTQETAAAAACAQGPSSDPGQLATSSSQSSLAVNGALWWSESNWRNRISVPLTFAPESNACSVVGAGTPVFVYGSELMTQASSQWAPTFCSTPSLFNFTHVQTSEPLARTLLSSGSADAAFSSQSPDGGFATPTDQAPVAVTGFAISYSVDDANGGPVTDLKLNARLLAKLMTESYTEQPLAEYGLDDNGNPAYYSYLAHNPLNITQDPEFIALNPGIARDPNSSVESALSAGASSLILLDGSSDLIYALTSYIESDREARLWLAGNPDPWGMVVNKNYNTSLNASLALPVYQWPLLDQTSPSFNGDNCATYAPSPWLPDVASPQASFAISTLAVQFASPPAKVKCVTLNGADVTSPSGYEYTPLGRQQPGARFTIGLTTLGQAQRYDLNTAALQSAETVPDVTEQFTDASNRTFVGPTTSALLAAAKTITADPSSNTWAVPYSSLSSTPTAYPGTMLVNADVPTTGLSSDLANDYANLLRYAAGPGQVAGSNDGQLPPGYLPMTAANGLGAEVEYTTRAAADVAGQTGQVTPIVASPASSDTSEASTDPGFDPSIPSDSDTSAPSGQTSAATAGHPTAPTSTKVVAVPRIKTASVHTAMIRLFVPIVLAIGVLGALATGGSYLRPRSFGRRR